MADYNTHVAVEAGPATTFSYLVDIANMAEWDPNVRSAEALTRGPPGIGSTYALTVGFYGKAIELTCDVVELESPHRIVLTVDGGRIHGRYLIEVTGRSGSDADPDASADEGCKDGADVNYRVNLQFRGAARALDRGLQLALNGIGENAVNGLRKQLNARAN